MRGSLDYYGGGNLASLVDKTIGDAYWVVKDVHDNLESLAYIVNNMQAIITSATSIAALQTAIGALQTRVAALEAKAGISSGT